MGLTLTQSVSLKPFTRTTLLSRINLGGMVCLISKECKITWHWQPPSPQLKCRNFRKLVFLLPTGQSEKSKNK